MIKTLTNSYWKSLFIISLLTGTIFLFRFITNNDIKILLGISGLLIMLYSFNQKSNR